MSRRGFSPLGLERMHRVLLGHIERKQVPGLVALVSHHGEVHVETMGALALESPAPMRRDTIFRIASLSKLITAAAAMILIEDCALRLDEPIDEWLPELANRRVLQSLSSELDDTIPARRAITVRDLLTYRMGFGSVMAPPDTYPIQRFIREYKIGGDGAPKPRKALPMDEWIKKLGSLPWMAQPGERWMYHVSGDVLGVLIARVSGRPFGAFLRERIFDPLGMKDTAFHVPAEKRERLSACYSFPEPEKKPSLFDGASDSSWSVEPPFESGGGGLVSTLDDYFAFSRMMLNCGRHEGGQILSRASVDLMTTDQLTPEQRADAGIFFGGFSSWGLGMAVDIGRREIFHSPGRYGWTGGLGATAYNDPAEQTIGILFTTRMMDSPQPPKVFADFWTLAYAAME